MRPNLSRLLVVVLLSGLIAACTREPEVPTDDLLQHVPADTPYVFVTSRELPDKLRARLADHYAAQLAAQGPVFARLRADMEASEETAPMALRTQRLFDVMHALFAEFEGRDTAAKLRELGIDPVTRSVIYGIGVLPAARAQILDAAKFDAMLARIERRAGVSASQGELNGQTYRRIDLGVVDAVLAVTEGHAIAGLLPDSLFDRDLGLLLGQRQPEHSLAQTDDIVRLIERYGFTGYGEGYLRIDELVAILLGRGDGRNAEVMQALGSQAVPVSPGCMRMTEQLVSGMPRMVIGVTAADEQKMALRAVWESTAPVAARLQKLAAPVPGLGGPYDGLVALGVGLDLPQLRNATEALLNEVMAAGSDCEWVDPASLQAVIPQLNLALGPMTAGIKGFNVQLADIDFDPQTMAPTRVEAGLLAAVDDPRGVFALGAMFNPELANVQVPGDGSFVELPQTPGLDGQAPPVKVAIRDKALLLVTGKGEGVAQTLLDAVVATPSPLLAIDYGVFRLVQRFGDIMDNAVAQLTGQGEIELAAELREQVDAFRLQAAMFNRLRMSMYASADGLVIDQVMELR